MAMKNILFFTAIVLAPSLYAAQAEGDRKIQAAQGPQPARVLFFGMQPTQQRSEQAQQQKESKLSAEKQKDLNKRFRVAVSESRLEDARKFLQQGADINSRNPEDFNIQQQQWAPELFRTIQDKETPAIQFLLANKADPNATSNTGDTSLFRAIRRESGLNKDQINLITRLLAAKANINHANDTGHTPLTIATQFSDISMIDFLLKHGASIDYFRIEPQYFKFPNHKYQDCYTIFNWCTPNAQSAGTQNHLDQPFADIKKFLDKHRWKLIQEYSAPVEQPYIEAGLQECMPISKETTTSDVTKIVALIAQYADAGIHGARPRIIDALESCIPIIDVKPIATLIAQYAATVPLGDHEIAVTLIQDGLPENIDSVERQSLASMIAEYTGTIHPGEPLRLIEEPKKPSSDDSEKDKC